MKKLIVFALVLALCLSIIACSVPVSQNTSTTPTASAAASTTTEASPAAVVTQPPDNKPVSIYFMTQTSEDSADAGIYRKIFQRYHDEVDPRLVLNAEYISDSNSYFQKLRTLIASNEMPDWFFNDANEYAMELRDEGLVYNVGAMLDELKVKDRFTRITTDFILFPDGSQYMFANSAILEFFWYHPSMFAEAGIEDTPKTWDEFFEVCEKLRAAGFTPIAGPSRMAMALRYAAFLPFRREGNQWLLDVISGKHSWGDETGIAMGNFLQKMNGYFNEGWAGMDNSMMRDYFLSYGAAIWYETSSSCFAYITTEDQQLIDDVDFIILPMVEGYSGSEYKDFFAAVGKGIMMNKTFVEDNKDLIYDFVKFWVDNYGDIAVYDYNILPGIAPANPDDMSDFYKELMDMFNAVEQYANPWDVKIDSVSNEILKAEIYNLILGEITPEKFAEIMDAAILENVINK